MKAILLISATGILLSLWLWLFKAKQLTSARYLVVLFFLIHFLGLIGVVAAGQSDEISLLISGVVYGSLVCTAGAVLFLYIRAVLTDNYRFTKSEIRFFYPSLIFLLVFLAGFFLFTLLGVDNQGQLMHREVAHQHTFAGQWLLQCLLAWFIPGCYLMFFGYLSFASFKFIRFLKRKCYQKILSGQKFMVYWLTVLFLFLLTGFPVYLLKMNNAFQMIDLPVIFSDDYFQIMATGGTLMMLVSMIAYPRVLLGMPRLPDVKPQFFTENQAVQPALCGKYKYSYDSEEDYFAAIGQNLDACMVQLKPFLQTRFNLAELSVLMNIPAHHLVLFFDKNEEYDFSEYRDKWRIKHAKDLMVQGKSSEMSIEAIGMLSGFNSYKSFLSAFRTNEKVALAKFETLSNNQS